MRRSWLAWIEAVPSDACSSLHGRGEPQDGRRARGLLLMLGASWYLVAGVI